MYGRKDGVTINQHLDEFDSYEDEQGHSFDEVMMDGLFSDDEALIPPPPPKPSTASKKGKSKANQVEADGWMDRLTNLPTAAATNLLVENPECRKATEAQALKGTANRRNGDEPTEIQKQNAQMLKDREAGNDFTSQAYAPDNEDGIRKRPFQKRRKA